MAGTNGAITSSCYPNMLVDVFAELQISHDLSVQQKKSGRHYIGVVVWLVVWLVVCLYADITDVQVSRTFQGLSQDFLSTFPGLSQDFLRTFSGHSQNFLRTFSGLSQDFCRTFFLGLS